MKWELLAWALGDSWRTLITSFLTAKDAIWKRMGFRSAVAKRQCDQIMALSGYCGVWTRSVQWASLISPQVQLQFNTLSRYVLSQFNMSICPAGTDIRATVEL